MNTFRLKIVTPASDFYSGEVEYMSADTTDGRIGFMRGALPRVCMLSKGVIEIKTSVISQRILCADGFIVVGSDGITVLSEQCRYDDDETQSETSDSSNANIDAAKVGLASSINKLKSKRDQN